MKHKVRMKWHISLGWKHLIEHLIIHLNVDLIHVVSLTTQNNAVSDIGVVLWQPHTDPIMIRHGAPSTSAGIFRPFRLWACRASGVSDIVTEQQNYRQLLFLLRARGVGTALDCRRSTNPDVSRGSIRREAHCPEEPTCCTITATCLAMEFTFVSIPSAAPWFPPDNICQHKMCRLS